MESGNPWLGEEEEQEEEGEGENLTTTMRVRIAEEKARDLLIHLLEKGLYLSKEDCYLIGLLRPLLEVSSITSSRCRLLG